MKTKTSSGNSSWKQTGRQSKTIFGLKSPRRVSTLASSLSIWSTRNVSLSLSEKVAADGTNIDNWTIDEIAEVVAEFVEHASQKSAVPEQQIQEESK